MVGNPMKPLAPLAAIFLCAAAAAALPADPFFEQVAGGAQGAWRTRGATIDMLVLRDGFALRKGGQLRRFRWRDSMQLDRLAAEQPLASASYVLGGAEAHGKRLRHAKSVRSTNADGRVSVLYSFGTRGLELDIEIAPGAELPQLRLESLDGDFSLTADGAVEFDGQPLALRPVSYNEDSSGERHVVASDYRLADRQNLEFRVGPRDAAKRLVIDPVVTYASYFGGSGEQEPIGIRELSDGSVVIAGNTDSFDLPLGVVLDTSTVHPEGISDARRCFVARLFPAERRIGFVSYLGPATDMWCRSMDADSQGRVLLLGRSSNLPGIATRGAQYPKPKPQTAFFLARLSANGSEIEYATYLRIEDNSYGNPPMFLRAAQGDRVYMGFSSVSVFDGSQSPEIPRGFHNEPTSALILRYDIAAKRFDALTYLPGSPGLGGLELSPAGLVYVYGGGAGSNFPLKHPIQHDPPPPGWYGGFVCAFSANLQRLIFSTYIGGHNSSSDVAGVQVDSGGGVWMVGNAQNGAIPGLTLDQPTEFGGSSVFAIYFVPGEGAWRKAFHAGGDNSLEASGALLLDNERICVIAEGWSGSITPGGATMPNGEAKLACLDDSAAKFEMLTPIGYFGWPAPNMHADRMVTRAAAGGIWSLGVREGDQPDIFVPREFKESAIQPLPSGVAGFDNDIVLRHIDLSIPRPKLLRPQTVYMDAPRDNYGRGSNLHGTNFVLGMRLEFDGWSIPLYVNSQFEASASFASEDNPRPGRFDGRLVIPAEPEPVASEPFPVIVGRRPPAPRPFLHMEEPLTIAVAEPVYPETEVLWRGQRLPLMPSGIYDYPYQFRIPSRLAQPGEDELIIRNPPPGGGVQRWKLLIRGTNAFPLIQYPGSPLSPMPADGFAVDRAAKILYVVVGSSPDEWTLSAHRLPEMERIAEIIIPKDEPKPRAAIDLEVSAGGKYLYMLDGSLRVRRFLAGSLAMDLEFDIPPDNYGLSGGGRMKALSDDPESIVVATRARRLVIYDRDRPRPYTTSDFPSRMFQQLAPVAATSEYVYAARNIENLPSDSSSPCMVRYPIDALGFSHPEEICAPESEWGAYPEMKRYGTMPALADGEATIHAYYGNARLSIYPPGEVYASSVGNIDARNGNFVWRLFFWDLQNGVLRGHYPRNGAFANHMASVTFVGESAMVYYVFDLYSKGSVAVVPNWREHVEWY